MKNRGTGGQARNDNIILRMCFTYWTDKITNTRIEYVTLLCLSMAAMFKRPQLGVTFIIHCLCLFVSLLAVHSVDQSGRKAQGDKRKKQFLLCLPNVRICQQGNASLQEEKLQVH